MFLAAVLIHITQPENAFCFGFFFFFCPGRSDTAHSASHSAETHTQNAPGWIVKLFFPDSGIVYPSALLPVAKCFLLSMHCYVYPGNLLITAGRLSFRISFFFFLTVAALFQISGCSDSRWMTLRRQHFSNQVDSNCALSHSAGWGGGTISVLFATQFHETFSELIKMFNSFGPTT